MHTLEDRAQEIEQAAHAGTPLEGHPAPEDWLYWKTMTMLYREYRAGLIDLDTAREEKQLIFHHYSDTHANHARYAACMALYQDNIAKGSKYVYQIRNALQSRTEPLTLMQMCIDLFSVLTGDDTVGNNLMEKIEEKMK